MKNGVMFVDLLGIVRSLQSTEGTSAVHFPARVHSRPPGYSIMVNYADLWLMHSHVDRLLDGAKLELRELNAHSRLLGACTSYPVLRSDLEASIIEIKDLKHILDYASRYSVLSPPCELCGSLKGKLLHATTENTELQ
jgi:hypothetical protein